MSDRVPQDQLSSLYPIPDDAILPPPQRAQDKNSSVSSSSSSSRKRKRGLDDASQMSQRPSVTRVSSASDFSNTFKAKVRAEHANKCWHCSASPADVCHVIGSRDGTFETAVSDGLIDISNKRHPHNAIALCGTCHRNFDDPYNPSFFFLPTDLKYFLRYESDDRKRRRRLGRRQGTIPARICPTAQTYQAHQVQCGIQEAALCGGFYTRLVLHDFLPEYPNRAPFVPGRSEYGATKSWSGSPMAALQQAIIMLRKLNLNGIPRDIVTDLRALQDIYSEPIDLDGVSDTDEENDNELGEEEVDDRKAEAYGIGGLQEEKAAYETDDVENIPQADEHGGEDKQVYGLEGNKSEIGYRDQVEVFQRVAEGHHPFSLPSALETCCSSTWRWGPGSTAKDVIKFFRAVI